MSTIELVAEADPFTPFKCGLDESSFGFMSGDTYPETYLAGFPSFARNFPRDTLISGVIAGHPGLLASQIAASAFYQGVKNDPLTGERPGKVHHEIKGVQLLNREGFTTYNACDTTPLFLIGAEALSYSDTDMYDEFMKKYHGNFERAVDHILESLGDYDNLYWDKTISPAASYALRVTYWKDSILPHANGKEEPKYPVTFAQAHFMAARGLLAASRILKEPVLEQKADEMYKEGIETFITPDNFMVYRDKEDELKQTSSDELHSLPYIPTTYADLLPLGAIQKRAAEIATPFGFMCTPPEISSTLSDKYHGDKIWVFEQAMIHYGASKFGLHQEATTAALIYNHIAEGQELFSLEQVDSGARLVPEGNPQQLWSVAAAAYFSGKSALQHASWL